MREILIYILKHAPGKQGRVKDIKEAVVEQFPEKLEDGCGPASCQSNLTQVERQILKTLSRCKDTFETRKAVYSIDR